MKRIFVISLIMMMLTPSVLYAEENQYELGTYYQLGKYNEEPIIWRCVDIDDENGILMVSDKILCYKAANVSETSKSVSSQTWEDSSIRIWLNSKEETVTWLDNNVPKEENLPEGYKKFAYDDESGFLSDKNFTEKELAVIKSVNQWQVVPIDRIDSATNGVTKPYIASYSVQASYGDSKSLGWVGIDEFNVAYKGAMYRVTDTMFFLNEPQTYSLYQVYGTCAAIGDDQNNESWYSGSYWLRTPYQEVNYDRTTMMTCMTSNNYYGGRDVSYVSGIRPAFYLNEDTAYIKSGSGTSDDPYILDGTVQEEIPVFVNGKQIKFNQPPVLENDYTLVGMRAIFEALGAEVEWNGSDKTVIATKDDTTIQLQIDNNTMQKDGVAIELGTPARLINDNTMVPIRAVSEALDTKVDWIANLERIVIDKQPEWIESEWSPEWYKQAMLAGGYVE